MRKILFIVLVKILIGISLISIFFIFKNKEEDYVQKKVFEEVINISNKSNDKEKEEEGSKIIKEVVNIKELYKVNNDIIGWIKIENTNINYPVMQTKENPNYYLKRNFYNQYSDYGTPYLSEYCNIKTSDNLIIYAHNMNGKKMFGELENYKMKTYYDNHQIINFYTMQENEKYEIISVFKTIAYTGFEYYKFYYAKDKREFDTFVNKCKELSFFDTGKTAKYGDKLITLSTCENSNKDGRLVVVARKIM